MSIIIVNGTAFATTAFDTTIAFNVANGDVLWTFLSPLGINQTAGRGNRPAPAPLPRRQRVVHDGDLRQRCHRSDAVVPGHEQPVYAINAITGKQEFNFTDFTGLSMVAGNNPQSIYNGIGASNIVINQSWASWSLAMTLRFDADNGRGFFAGWNLNTNPPTMKWITYDVPPQPGSQRRR